jgi:hypothetical protein
MCIAFTCFVTSSANFTLVVVRTLSFLMMGCLEKNELQNITQCKFKVCKSVHHHTIQINQPTSWNNPSCLLLDVYLHLNMFRASSHPSSGAQQLQQQPLVLPSERGDSSAVGHGWAGRPKHNQQHCYHHALKVKPEAATAVVELLMMSVRTPETCWAVNKRQVMN